MDLILYEENDRRATITMNRPDKRNALSPELVSELKKAFIRADENDKVKVVILTGNGDAFSAGADLAYLQSMQEFSYKENLQDSHHLKSLFLQIYNFPKPVIAKVQGHAIAGGCGLATVCDFVYASEQASLGYSEVRIGFVPAIVMLFLIRKIGESKASELLLSGQLIPASVALEKGLVHRVFPGDKLDEEVMKFCDQLITRNSAESMRLTKKFIKQLPDLHLEQALEQAAELNARARGTDDCQRGIASFLNKSPVEW